MRCCLLPGGCDVGDIPLPVTPAKRQGCFQDTPHTFPKQGTLARMQNPIRQGGESSTRRRCLTEFAIPTLIAGALGVSALLWLLILAVL